MEENERSLLARTCGPLKAGSLRGCIVSLVFSALGAGMLSLPWAVSRLGLVAGICVLLASAIFSYATMEMLIFSGISRNTFEYAATMENILGPAGAAFANLIVSLDSAGAICVFYKYMADSWQLLAASLGYHISTSTLIVGLSFCVVLPLSLPQRITALQKAAVGSIVPLAVVVGVVVWRSSYLASQEKVTRMLVRPDLFSIESAQACSSIFFSFMCHMNVWAVRNELYNPIPGRTSKVLWRAAVVLFIVYASVAVAGSISFGEATPANILQAYPTSDVANCAAHVLMAIMLIVCSVLCVHPVRNAIAGLLGYDIRVSAACFTQHAPSPSISRTPSCCKIDGGNGEQVKLEVPFLEQEKGVQKHEHIAGKPFTFGASAVLTVCVVTITCIVAVEVPSLVDLLGVLGGFFGVMLMFVLPTFIYTQTKQGVRAVLSVICTTVFVVIGLVASVGSLIPGQ